MLVGGIVVALVVMVAAAGRLRDPADGTPVGSAWPSSAIATAGQATAGAASPTATTATETPTPTPVPGSVVTPTPVRTAAVTAPPRASGPPRLAYAAFLARVNGDRATVNDLDAALSAAAERQDTDAVRHAAVGILDFVDGERDWLREHPPAECYAAAHAAANAMLEAYGAAADRFIGWADAGGGLAGLTALGRAVDAAQAAGDSLTSFGKVLDTTACPV